MLRNKKFLVIAIVIAVVLVGTVTGVALAQAGSSGTTPAPAKTFAARVAAILGIDQQKVQDAMSKAKRDIADEALSNKLDALVKSGKMTQQQADQYKSWWQSRPQGVLPQAGTGGKLGGHRFGGMWPRLQPPQTTIPAQ